jgi:hypothetical protein
LWAQLTSKSATPAYSSYDNTSDSQEAQADSSAPSAATNAAAVWNALTASHTTSGTYGNSILTTSKTLSELSTGAPAATPTIEQCLMLLYMALRNKYTTTDTEVGIHNDAGTKIAKAPQTRTSTTYTREEFESG